MRRPANRKYSPVQELTRSAILARMFIYFKMRYTTAGRPGNTWKADTWTIPK